MCVHMRVRRCALGNVCACACVRVVAAHVCFFRVRVNECVHSCARAARCAHCAFDCVFACACVRARVFEQFHMQKACDVLDCSLASSSGMERLQKTNR